MPITPTSLPQSGFLTPPQVGLACNVPLPTATQGAGLTVGIISLGGGFRQSDLARSFADLKTAGLLPADAVAPTVNVTLIDGATGTFGVNSSHDFENTADIYCVGTMVPGASINIYIGAGRTSLDNCIAQAVADHVDVITISWGYDDSVYGDFCASSLAAAALARIPVLACTGDYGSAAYSTDTNEYPQYPASSPLVIAVGGTHLTLDTNNQRLTETVESNDPEFSSDTGWSGGGGISSLFSAPSWQAGLTYTPYNTSTGAGSPTVLTNRGTPDISLAMNAYVLYKGGGLAYFGGTSAATPVMAGIMVRLIEATGKRQSSPDWNKFFYSNYNASTFYDITSGNNATDIADGYLATSGWDPVVGLGVPNGIGLYNALLPTPTPRRVVNRGATPTPTPTPLPTSVNLLTVASGAKPQLRDYNSLVADLTILASGYYGYSMTSTLQSPRGPITQNEWASLYDDVQACYIHQNGYTATNIVRATTSTVIRAHDVNNLESIIQTLIVNTSTVAANQLTISTLNTLYNSGAVWSNDWHYAITYNWAGVDQVHYFFNLGGIIKPQFSATGVDLNDDWLYLINWLNGLSYGYTNFVLANPFNATVNSGSNYVTIGAEIVGPKLTIGIDFTSTNVVNNLLIQGLLATTYSNNLSGGIQSPVPVPVITSGGSLTPLPIPTFEFPVNGSSSTVMVVGNQTGHTVDINLSLSGYNRGTVTPPSIHLPNNATAPFTISYSGTQAGAFTGNLIIDSSIGNGVFPTNILVGTSLELVPSTAPSATVTENAPIYTGFFTVNAVGINASSYTVTLSNTSGFSILDQNYNPIPAGTIISTTDQFCIGFDPSGLSNSDVTTLATVAVGAATAAVSFDVTVDISPLHHLGSWISSLASYNAVLGLSYDIIGGQKCITIGIGSVPSLDTDHGQTSPDISELGQSGSTFAQWVEVYRIPLTQGAYTYYSTADYLVQSGDWGIGGSFLIGSTFGLGASQGAICTIVDDGYGNLGISLNSLYSLYFDDERIYTTQIDLSYCFNYYDEISNRYTQLETSLPNGSQTDCFAGFNSSGQVQTSLTLANLYSSVNDSGGNG